MVGPSLYQLATEFESVADTLGDMDLPPEVIDDTLESLSGELEVKSMNVARFFLNLESTVDGMKKAEALMSHRRKMAQNRIERMKHYLLENMQRAGIAAIDGPEFSLKVVKNPPAVIVDNENQLASRFVKVVTTHKVDKTAIKTALKAGEVVDGAHLMQGTRLAIK